MWFSLAVQELRCNRQPLFLLLLCILSNVKCMGSPVSRDRLKITWNDGVVNNEEIRSLIRTNVTYLASCTEATNFWYKLQHSQKSSHSPDNKSCRASSQVNGAHRSSDSAGGTRQITQEEEMFASRGILAFMNLGTLDDMDKVYNWSQFKSVLASRVKFKKSVSRWRGFRKELTEWLRKDVSQQEFPKAEALH